LNDKTPSGKFFPFPVFTYEMLSWIDDNSSGWLSSGVVQNSHAKASAAGERWSEAAVANSRQHWAYKLHHLVQTADSSLVRNMNCQIPMIKAFGSPAVSYFC
jgi:hypothetical protein